MKYGNIKRDNFEIIIKANDTDDFSQLSIINGINPRNGGSQVNYILDKIIPPIREKLVKKFKTIKPADIKNKIKLMVIARFVPALEFTSQEKIEISNSKSTWDKVFEGVKWDKIVRELLKDEDLMLSITEYFTLKEQAKENAELKKLAKTTKKIKSEKYLPATQFKKRLIIGEGASAVGGLIPSLGRKENGYYELKGVPLNAWEVNVSALNKNVELSELFKIITNENYKEIVIASDYDVDGHHIFGLLVGFFCKFLPNYLPNIKRFKTPIIIIQKNKKIQDYYFSLDEDIDTSKGDLKYMKGLGEYTPELLGQVIEKEGFENMLISFEVEDEKDLDDWLSKEKSDKRKELLKNYSLDINKV